MSNVSTYQFGIQNIRVVDIEGQPWFVASDVRRVLSIAQAGSNFTFLSKDEVQPLPRGLTSGKGMGRALVLSESGLYKFILRSDKPEAKAFQDWVTRVVLPAIRKDGAYVMGEEKVATGEMSEDELVLKAMGILQAKMERLTKEKEALQAENARILPAAQVGATVGQRSRLGVVDFARKLPGVNTMQVQRDLQAMQYLFKREGHWAVYHGFKGVLFDEKAAPEGRTVIVAQEKGQ